MKAFLNKYYALGWSIISIRTNSKVPMIRWKKYQHQIASPETIAQWFAKNQSLNIAVVLGRISGDLACRDFDCTEDYQQWATSHPNLANFLATVKTPNGYHVYFVSEGDCKTKYLKNQNGKPVGELRRWLLLPSPAVYLRR